MGTPTTIVTSQLLPLLSEAIKAWRGKDIFILTDTKTYEYCLPKLLQLDKLKESHIITIKNGDENKNIHAAIKIWDFLTTNGATRHSLMINLGGGMITDIGGFAASTFKRGISYINVSTTLLGAVDAATGGKTGINFLGYKNELGVFAPATYVFIDVAFFRTLDNQNLRSGFAEMIKHALINSVDDWNDVLNFDLENINYDRLSALLHNNIAIKERIVQADPAEKGIRKALNFGHTLGHAFESLSYKKESPMLHGYAIAWGMVCELYLSVMKLHFPKEIFLNFKYFITENYGKFECTCTDYDDLIELMKHDKKNKSSDEINFTLLSNIGEVVIDQTASRREIEECINMLF